MEEKKFYLGLDIGTDSVGWAVTDDTYHLIKKQGKHLWGSRLFEEASDASARRSHRAARRRYQRRRERLLILRSLFKGEMDKVDPEFFERLDESSLHKEDKKPGIHLPYIISNTKQFSTYKTIFHLRQAMLREDRKFDIREVYLVIAHMVKYRGNFLHEGAISDNGVSDDDVKSYFDEIDSLIEPCFSEEDEETPRFDLTLEQAKALIELFKLDMNLGVRFDKETNILGEKPTGVKMAVVKFINGSKMKLQDFFVELKEDPEKGKKAVSADLDDFESAIADFDLTDDQVALLLKLKEAADSFTLVNLLKGKPSITEAMVDIYNDYHIDLQSLKTAVAELERLGIEPVGYKKKFFNDPCGDKGKAASNYAGFCGKTAAHGRLTKCKQEEFLKTIKDIVDKLNEREDLSEQAKKAVARISKRMEIGKFMLRQNSKANGVLPYQLNENELRAIIERQGKYYPFLLDRDKGFPNPNKQEYKIISLLRYRIPYYVGPLSNPVDGKHLKNHWVVKKDYDVKIYPWNFFDVVDRAKTAKAFMDNLRNSCSYIKGEETLPKNSLIFQEYKVLNELNNHLYGGSPIDEDMKKYLFENLYLKKKTIKKKDLKEALRLYTGKSAAFTTRRSEEEKEDEKDDKMSSLSSFIDFEKILGQGFYKDKALFEKAEKVIATITAFEDKATRTEQLSELLDEGQAAAAAALKYKDYATLSRRLLDGIKSQCEIRDTGEIIPLTILDLLKRTSLNFMEIYEDDGRFSFKKQVDEINAAYAGEIGNEADMRKTLIDESYANPALKRALFQTLHIIDELKHILRIDHFDRIFVECTRAPGEKKKTTSRKDAIKKQLASVSKDLAKQINEVKKQLEGKTDDQLRGKHLYLYFMQMGRDVYTGEPINLERLSKDYDIDHIIPQAYVKDDSFMNTILTSRAKNNTKSKEYPIPQGFITKEGRQWIEVLVANKMMPKEKADRILRVNPLSDNELSGFVNRQLVTTSQSVKAVIEILKLTENTKPENIIYSKASLVSDFRGFFYLPKVRDLNDFHHANDAYLNIVVGDIYNQKFSNRLTARIIAELKERNKDFSLKSGPESVFTHPVWARGYSKKMVWMPCEYKAKHFDFDNEIPTENATINLVRKTLSWNDPMVTWVTFRQTGKQGFFNKISYVPKKEATDKNYPLKKVPEGMTATEFMQKYGAYSDMTTAYFCLVKSKKGYSLEGVLSLVDSSLSKDPDEKKKQLEKYFVEKGIEKPEIVLDYVPLRTILVVPSETGTAKIAISGRTGNSIIGINASEASISKEWIPYLKSVSKITGSALPAGKKKDLSEYEKNEPFREEIIEGQAKVTRNQNLEFFKYIANSLYQKEPYRSLPGIGKTLSKLDTFETGFANMTTIQQLKLIITMVELVSCKSVQQRKLSVLDPSLPANFGTITINKTLKPGTLILKVSPTGFYKTEIVTIPEN